MKIAGTVLIALGILALIYGGFSYNRERTLVDLGPIKATTTEHRAVPLSPLVGVVATVVGLLLVITPRRRVG